MAVSVSTTAVSATTVGDFIDAVASDDPDPSGGAISATVAALAAGLAAMGGRYALRRDPDSTRFGELVDRADEIRALAGALADEDIAAYGQYVAATRLPKDPDPEPRCQAVRAALDASAGVPLELARLAGEIAAIGEHLAVSGNPHLRSDACTATLLAAAAANSAATLVGENLRGRVDDPRVSEVGRLAAGTAGAARRVLGSFDYLQDREAQLPRN